MLTEMICLVTCSLYELMRRSTSAECGLAAKSRASATLNAFQHSVLQTYWYKSLGFNSSRSFDVSLKKITVLQTETNAVLPTP